MNLKFPYYYFTKALDDDFCDKIKKTALEKKVLKGVTYSYNKSNKTKKDLKKMIKTRNSDIIFLNDQWIFDGIVPYIKEANKNANWNFDFDWCEDAQFTIYKKNQHYDWHMDSYDEPYDCSENINYHQKIRKLSCSILLNDSVEYKGGELNFDLRNNKTGKNIKEAKELKNKGSMIVFPSHLWHKVNPVTKGIRYSLVVWFLGKPFV